MHFLRTLSVSISLLVGLTHIQLVHGMPAPSPSGELSPFSTAPTTYLRTSIPDPETNVLPETQIARSAMSKRSPATSGSAPPKVKLTFASMKNTVGNAYTAAKSRVNGFRPSQPEYHIKALNNINAKAGQITRDTNAHIASGVTPAGRRIQPLDEDFLAGQRQQLSALRDSARTAIAKAAPLRGNPEVDKAVFNAGASVNDVPPVLNTEAAGELVDFEL